jgi:hypothetical protein
VLGAVRGDRSSGSRVFPRHPSPALGRPAAIYLSQDPKAAHASSASPPEQARETSDLPCESAARATRDAGGGDGKGHRGRSGWIWSTGCRYAPASEAGIAGRHGGERREEKSTLWTSWISRDAERPCGAWPASRAVDGVSGRSESIAQAVLDRQRAAAEFYLKPEGLRGATAQGDGMRWRAFQKSPSG